jgi:hypothetical protein
MTCCTSTPIFSSSVRWLTLREKAWAQIEGRGPDLLDRQDQFLQPGIEVRVVVGHHDGRVEPA